MKKVLWVAGARVVLAGNDWRFLGVYTSKEKAWAAIQKDPRIRWIVPIEADAPAGEIDWTTVEYIDE